MYPRLIRAACFRGVVFSAGVVVAVLLAGTSAAAAGDGDAIVIVNGQSITKDQLFDLLVDARGLAAMQQLIVLELAKQETRRRGIEVSRADVQAEFQRSLDKIATQADGSTKPLSDADKRAALDQVLTQKGLSLAEFMIGMERNAHLRKLVERELNVTDQTLREEFARTYGEKVQVRHIQLAENELNEALDLLSKGADFADLARRMSHNAETAARGGALTPFTFDDDGVPAALREVAFGLAPGQVSAPVRIGKWVHLVKLEKRIPPESAVFEEVRDKVAQRLRERVIPQEMARLAQDLFKKATVRVLEPKLKKGYEELLKQNAIADSATQP